MSESTIQLVLLEYDTRGKNDEAKDRWDQIMINLTFHDQKLELCLEGDRRL